MNSFTCVSLSPIELNHPSLAVATTRSGGIGVLDREFCNDRDLDKATRNLDKLIELVDELAVVGLRLRVEQIASSQILLNRLCARPHWIILCGWTPQSLEEMRATLPASSSRQLLLEVTDIEQALALSPLVQGGQGGVDGLIAKGHESGGWVGEDSAFVLTQKLLGKQSLPIYVQGGVGIHTVAACYAAGARGVVLDDQLWLMPESPLPVEWQSYLNNLNGQEAIVIGERLSRSCRVLSRPGFQVISTLQKLAEQIELSDAVADNSKSEHPKSKALLKVPGEFQPGLRPATPSQNASQTQSRPEIKNPQFTDWQQQAQSSIGWGTPGTVAWPMGQAVGIAASIRDRYKTTGRFVQALLQASREHAKIAQKLQPLGANAPLAVSHGTKYPIVQGPMTRVSDTAEFANAVSQAGALPLLALSLMQGKQVRELLHKTKTLLGDRSWGIGILGFVPQAVREEQLKEVKAVKPPFALIAGGRPDQAAHLEAQGIATYLHVPVPTLLKMFLEQGARRFVFEGRECGGHVGPLSSFLLWESMIETLLKEVPKGAEQEIHVLFAGGIHDARSAAMVSAMAAPLAERGIRIGVLMGSAYLFTEEAVSCGAIVKEFQAAAIACTRTVNLETGPGHASRCAITPFAKEFYATRRHLLANGSSAEEIKNALEDLTLGRLRIASKGLVRDSVGQIVAVETDQQMRDGMYMIGQVATLRDKTCGVKDLHENVSEGSTELLAALSVDLPAKSDDTATQPSDIAIIGIATLLPQAQHPEKFWENILQKVDAITEIPSSRWDWRLYYDSNRHARDKIYSKWGGFIDDVPFDPMRFGIPPKSLKSIEPLQLLALETVRRALDDAGLASGEFDRENTSVILGAGGGIADLGQQYATRSEIPRMVDAPSQEVWERLPEWTEESFPGLLLNVIAGRVANRLDFGGSNFTVDAACASSLAAVDLAVKELESGRSNVVIAGGVDTVQSPFAYMCFSKTQALSPQGKVRTFDKNADGIVISEGIAVVVLKRLADAERDGDRIYAVIKAVAGSSDGKALGMTAPLPAGQMRALNRAYKKAGFSPKTLGLYEAHGTGTVAGDRAELETIVSTLKSDEAASSSCAIGSVKTSIGHTKSTAGIAGLVKVALSLHHKVLPPHVGVETPLDAIAQSESPVYLLKEAQPWLRRPDYPRRASVSAFGFGGTNFHAVLEEYQGKWEDTGTGADGWPCELLVWRKPNRQALTEDVRFLLTALASGAEPRLSDLAYTLAKQAVSSQNCSASLTVVVSNLEQLKEALQFAIAHVEDKNSSPLPPHIQLGWETPKTKSRIAFLFPGQGAQYPEMAREVALYFQEMRQALEFADKQLQPQLPKLLSQFIYPPSAYCEADEVRNQQLLTDTRIAQPAIGAVESGYLDIITKLGLKADMVAGHSYGEYAALYAAGVLSREAFFKLSDTRGRVMATACEASDGAMAAVQITREDLLQRISQCRKVVLANHNAPLQSVISGEREEVEHIVDSLNVVGIMARMLPVAGAFHSALVESAQEALAQAIASANIETPKIPVYANSTARPYKSDIDAIRHQLSQHVISPVEFVGQINAMYDDGARIFVEVGPKSILTKLVSKILEDRKHTVVSLDGQGGKLQGLLQGLGTLIARGVDLDLTALFEGRQVQQLDLSRLVELTRKPDLPPTAWLVNGGGVRSQTEAIGYTGKIPPLSLETAAQARKAREIQQQEHREAAVNKTVPPAAGPTIAPAQPPKPAPVNPVIQRKTALPMSMPTSNGASYPQATPASHSNPHIPVSQDAALAAYQAYQQTMRQFLSLQEQVMRQFLGGAQPSQIVPPPTPPAPTLAAPIPPSRPVLLNGNHHANGAVRPPVPSSEPNDATTFSPVPASEVILPPKVEPVLAAVASTPVPASSSTPDRAGFLQILLQLVSDRTGYPIEMLGLDQDLEAELGIDSIKRVEILGALQKTLPSPLAASIQEQMESLTRVKSLNAVVEQLLGLKTGEVGRGDTQTWGHGDVSTPLSASSAHSSLDKTTLTQTLLRLVSDRTGYPIEMLGLDQDLEAELGIDSIKRVEILGALQKSLPEPMAASVQSRMESLTRVKSLNSLIEQLLSLPSTAASAAEEKNGLGKLTAGGSR